MTEQTKRCYECGEVKQVSLFYKDRSRRDGFESKCKSCRKAYYKSYYEANRVYYKSYYEANRTYYKKYREDRKDHFKTYREANKEAKAKYDKAYREANKESLQEKDRVYYQNNKEYYFERAAARRANKKKNTPKFIRDCPVDKQRRVFAYNLSRLLTETTGVLHHVDHMWPISDGGPHWSGNLQVIPAVDNLSKNATVDEEIKKTIKEGLEYARRESKG